MGKRVSIGVYVVIFLFAALFFKLWYLQVIKGGEYKKFAERNRLRIIEIPAPRGIIYDKNNTVLVKNIPSFDISVAREDFPENPETLSALGKLLGLKPDDIKDRLESVSANPFKPVTLQQNISLEEVARVAGRKIDFPFLRVDVVVNREYIYGQFASHVIGYLGRLNLKQTKDPGYYDVPREAFIGQLGIEKVYDRILRGTAGKKVIEVDAIGRVIRVVGLQHPVNGEDIRLTIDMNLQVAAEESLIGKTGAVVALDPNTGEILALASTPSFDPNLFARGINYEDWKRLINDPFNPFLNRALQSQYPPGSTFKIITAIAALEEGIITEDTRFQCNGSINFGRVFRCWKEEGHGNINLHKAIVESCDVYFYEIGKKLGIDTLAHYASDFGIGRPVGIELDGERTGIVPTTEWKFRTKKQKWYKGETLNTVIGQGYLSATPIQMARLMAAVVNGGKLYRLHLLRDEAAKNTVENEVRIRPENVDFIKKALIGVVAEEGGTGWMARSDIVRIGGKTGTTQVIGGKQKEGNIPDKYRDHAWFVAFAPEKNPQIVVGVFVEHGGHGSTAAAPIAKKVIEAYFKKL
jgi:penicillin-binding protein 2